MGDRSNDEGRPGTRERAKRSLGQNFLIDPNLQRKVIEELAAEPGDLVIEVGPGHGELSRHLVGRVARLVLIEKDRTLAEGLETRWGDRPDVEVVHGDALELGLAAYCPEGEPFRVVSNVPYNITSPLLFAFLELWPPPRRIVVTVQREVAERIVAEPGSRVYGALSVGVQSRATARLAFRIRRGAFRPVPGVDSAVVRIDPDPEKIEALPDRTLRRVTRAAFGMRRKQLQKILRSAEEIGLSEEEATAICERLELDPRTRPERLSPESFVSLAWLLAGHLENRRRS